MTPLEMHSAGFATIPIHAKSKRAAVPWHRYQRELPDRTDVERWFGPGSKLNAAVVCGWNGLAGLDFDTFQHYAAWQKWAEHANTEAREVARHTLRVRTARGVHVYVCVADQPRKGQMCRQWGEIQGRGSYLLMPPSIHPSGIPYRPINDGAPILPVLTLALILPEPPAVDPTPTPSPDPLPTGILSGLFPPSLVERIKAGISIADLVPEVRRNVLSFQSVRCPLHDDHTPSLYVRLSDGICRCHTGCTGNKPLDVIGLYARLHNLSNADAIRDLSRRL